MGGPNQPIRPHRVRPKPGDRGIRRCIACGGALIYDGLREGYSCLLCGRTPAEAEWEARQREAQREAREIEEWLGSDGPPPVTGL